MGRRGRKRKQQQQQQESSNNNNNNDYNPDEGWIDVPVGLSQEETSSSTNHYDDNNNNNNNNSAAADDLEAQPGEEVAMFYGLQVLDTSRFVVSRDGKLLRVDDEYPSGSAAADTNNNNNSSTTTTTTTTGDDQEHTQEKSDNKSAAVQRNPKEESKKKKKKRSKKKKKTSHESSDDANNPKQRQPENNNTTDQKSDTVMDLSKDQNNNVKEDTHFQLDALQSSWCAATGGVLLEREGLCRALFAQQFWTPTAIQAAALPAAILGRANVVGAAPTGSGKTLAFLLPIAQYLLLTTSTSLFQHNSLQALILTPTRELALQIQNEGQKLLHNKKSLGVLVGGLAHAKQVRVLDQDRPPILVATVGRLWELVSRSVGVDSPCSYCQFCGGFSLSLFIYEQSMTTYSVSSFSSFRWRGTYLYSCPREIIRT